MNKQKWIKIWFIIIMIIPTVGLFNYLIDPYGMNNFLKIERLNAHKKGNALYTFRVKTPILIDNNFNTLMLGTSRIGVMDPSVIEEDIGGKVFNLAVPASTTEIQRKMFLYALQFNNIKRVIYGIDFMSFNDNRSIKKNFTSFDELSSKIENKERIHNYDFYFNLDTLYESISVLYHNIIGKEFIEIEYSTINGMRDHKNHIHALKKGTLNLDNNIEYSIKEYFESKQAIYANYKFSKKYLEEFKKIIDYCRSHNIEVWVYIPPIYSTHFEMIASQGYLNEFETFKRELVKITNYIDFTGNNNLTKNKNNYWDSSHLRRELTPVIMNNVLHHSTLSNDLRVGTFVTQGNIEKHLSALRKSLEVAKAHEKY